MASGGDIGSLPPEVLEKAKRELNEDPDQIAAKIQELRELVQQKKETGQTGDTPLLRLDDDAFLLRFLRAKKYRLDDVCKLYLNYCEYRITHKEVMEGLCLDKVRYLFEDGILGILEPRTKSGCRIMVIFPGRTDLTIDTPTQGLETSACPYNSMRVARMIFVMSSSNIFWTVNLMALEMAIK